MSNTLLDIRTAHLNHTEFHINDSVQTLTQHFQELYGEHLLAVLFYGSCRHQPQEPDGITDLYVIVSDYQKIWPKRRLLATAAAVLPPNVFFLQHQLSDDIPIRCKYAVLTLRDFEAGCSGWFHSYIYGRFAQPVAIAYCQSQTSQERLIRALTNATDKLLTETLPCILHPFTTLDLWQLALRLSYGAELRPEPAGRIDQLINVDSTYYENTARCWLASQAMVTTQCDDQNFTLPAATSRHRRIIWRLLWKGRSWWGKLLSMFRLAKALATFDGAIDYAIYKVEKHTGEPIQISEPIRRRALLFIPVLIFKLLRATI